VLQNADIFTCYQHPEKKMFDIQSSVGVFSPHPKCLRFSTRLKLSLLCATESVSVVGGEYLRGEEKISNTPALRRLPEASLTVVVGCNFGALDS
jgi:hypothetical protein